MKKEKVYWSQKRRENEEENEPEPRATKDVTDYNSIRLLFDEEKLSRKFDKPIFRCLILVCARAHSRNYLVSLTNEFPRLSHNSSRIE